MSGRTNSRRSPPSPPAAVAHQLIVARDQPELYRSLRRRLRHYATVAVFLDRRERERREAARAVPVDRRREERRATLDRRNDLHQRAYIFARPLARCPQD